MTDRPQYPRPPWRLAVPFLAAGLTLYGAVHVLKPGWPLLQREYWGSYVLLSVTPFHQKEQPVIVDGKGRMATLRSTGALHRETAAMRSAPEWRAWLQTNIYEGKTLWRFLWLPELLALLAALPLLIWAVKSIRKASRDAWDGKVKRGARLISHARWNRLIRRENRGFYIEAK